MAALRPELGELMLDQGGAVMLQDALATAALPKVPGSGGETSGCLDGSTTFHIHVGTGIRFHGIHTSMSLPALFLGHRPPLRQRTSPHSWPLELRTIAMGHSASPKSQQKAKGRRAVRGG